MLTWKDNITDEDITRRAGTQDFSQTARNCRLGLPDHVLRMPENKPASIVPN